MRKAMLRCFVQRCRRQIAKADVWYARLSDTNQLVPICAACWSRGTREVSNA